MKALPIIKRILSSAATALFVAFVTFFALYHSPGDPAEMMLMEKMVLYLLINWMKCLWSSLVIQLNRTMELFMILLN